jgi:hypothetical protein
MCSLCISVSRLLIGIRVTLAVLQIAISRVNKTAMTAGRIQSTIATPVAASAKMGTSHSIALAMDNNHQLGSQTACRD